MNDKVFYEHAKERMEEYGLEYDDKIKDILERGYKVLQWRDKQPNKRITPTEFRKHIQFTLEAFQEINNYVHNDGYIKLSKRCSTLLKELDIYQAEPQKLHPKIANYFSEKFCENLPTKSNILVLIYSEFKKHHGSNFYGIHLAPVHLKEIISNIFNKGKPFKINAPKYRQITLTLSGQTIKLQNYRVHDYPTNREVEYTYPSK